MQRRLIPIYLAAFVGGTAVAWELNGQKDLPGIAVATLVAVFLVAGVVRILIRLLGDPHEQRGGSGKSR